MSSFTLIQHILAYVFFAHSLFRSTIFFLFFHFIQDEKRHNKTDLFAQSLWIHIHMHNKQFFMNKKEIYIRAIKIVHKHTHAHNTRNGKNAPILFTHHIIHMSLFIDFGIDQSSIFSIFTIYKSTYYSFHSKSNPKKDFCFYYFLFFVFVFGSCQVLFSKYCVSSCLKVNKRQTMS